MSDRRAKGLCSYKQARILASWGYDARMPAAQAGKILDEIFSRPAGQQYTREDAIRRANRQRKLRTDALVAATKEARVLWGTKGGWLGLEIGPPGSREVIKNREAARTVYRTLQERGVPIAGVNPAQQPTKEQSQ